MSLQTSLSVRGISLHSWRHGSEFHTFYRDPFDGLLDLRTSLRLIALFSHRPGSGQLPAFISLLEEAVDEQPVPTRLEVVQLWNKPLLEWFGRRPGYRICRNDEFGWYAEHERTKPTCKRAD